MSDATTDLQADTPDSPEEEVLSHLPLAEVHELFVTLGKALRAFQLYDENNPVYQRFVSALADAFRSLWSELDQLHVQVTEDSIRLDGAEVYRSDSRSESLAFLFYKDGVRAATFLPGIEDAELTRFLSVLQRARSLRPEGDDLLTILWEEDLDHFRYQYVDLLAEGVVVPESGPGHTQQELREVIEEETEDVRHMTTPEGTAEPERAIQREDFNPTLYSLDAREMEHLRLEIEREMERDLRADVLAALFDRLEEPEERERQTEIIEIFRQVLPNFLSRGALTSARDVLAHLRDLEARDGVFDEGIRDAVEGLVDELSARATIEELIRSLEDGSIEPSPAELGGFLSHLRGAALSSLLRAAETTEVKELQPVLREAVRGIARKNQKALKALLDDPDPVVIAGAARLVGKMQVTEVGPVLGDLMFHLDSRVRLAAVEAARDMRASTAAAALVDALHDPDRNVRIAAARALGALRYRPAANEFADIVSGRDIRGREVGEKIAFFESFGTLAGEEAVPLLDKLLNGRGFLGRRQPDEIRAAAALGLGKIDGDAARAALERATSEEEPVVRSAVNRARREEDQ